MGRKSAIDRLPLPLRKEIARLREEQGCTLDEILAHLQALAPSAEISRSSLGRYTKRIDAMGAILKDAREGATALVAQLGERGEGDVQRLNVELAQSLLTRVMISEEGEAVSLDPKESMFLASAIKSLTGASRDNAAFVEAVEKRARAKAAELAKSAAKAAGISAELADTIAATILGVAPVSASVGVAPQVQT